MLSAESKDLPIPSARRPRYVLSNLSPRDHKMNSGVSLQHLHNVLSVSVVTSTAFCT